MTTSPNPSAGPRYQKPHRLPVWAIVLIVLAAILVLGLCIAAILFAVEGMMHGSGAYQSALKTAQSSPCVVNTLGTPIQTKWITTGDINVNNDEGSANLDIPLYGPKDSGSLELEATRANGIWKIDSLVFAHRTDRVRLVPAESNRSACN